MRNGKRRLVVLGVLAAASLVGLLVLAVRAVHLSPAWMRASAASPLGVRCLVIIGVGMLGFTIYSAFVKTFVLVERERIVTRTVFGSRERMKEFSMDPTTRAALEESYRQNDNPVYRIAIKGGGGKTRFGTALESDEKNWLVAVINEFIMGLAG